MTRQTVRPPRAEALKAPPDLSLKDQISAYYSSRPVGFDTTVRNSLNGLPFEEQYQFGIDVIQRALNGQL